MKIRNYLLNIVHKINYGEKDLFAISLAFALTALDIIIIWLFHIGAAIALPLICISISPLYILAFRAGIFYALMSSICSFILLIFIKGPVYASIQIALLWLPALITSALLVTYRTNAKGNVIYLPLAQIFFSMILVNIAVITSILTLILHNSANVALLKSLINHQLNYISEANSNLPVSMQLHFLEIKKIILDNFLKILACLVAGYNMIFMLSNLYVGLTISRRLKLLPRKNFYWPKDLRLPLASLAIFALSLIGLLYHKNAISLYSIIIATSFAVAFFMCGIAYWHDITRRVPFRPIILSLSYIGLLFSVSSPALCCTVLLMGLWSIIKHYKIHKYLL